MLKKILLGSGIVLAVAVIGAIAYGAALSRAYDDSMDKVYDVPLGEIALSDDPLVLARGQHLAKSIAGCALGDCHGADLAGGKTLEVGPLGLVTAPNITGAGLGVAYTNPELARLIKHGVKKDGRSVRFMPAQDFNWLSDSDVVAIISYVRSLPPVQRDNGPLEFKAMAKVLDRHDAIMIDIARRIDHGKTENAPEPAPTKEYGSYIARMCVGCHGATLGGGRIPGTPPSMPVPLNITPHETGLKEWSYEDFGRLLNEGVRKNGQKLDPFMPLAALTEMDDTERRALWAYLMSAPSVPFGQR